MNPGHLYGRKKPRVHLDFSRKKKYGLNEGISTTIKKGGQGFRNPRDLLYTNFEFDFNHIKLN